MILMFSFQTLPVGVNCNKIFNGFGKVLSAAELKQLISP
jgi:hypothetical protein